MNQANPQTPTSPAATAPTRSELASRLYEQGRLAEAEPLLRGLVAANPRDARSMQLLGLIAWKQGRQKEAVALLQQAAALAPDNPAVLSNLGAILYSLGSMAPAERALRRALELQPKFADALCNLGNVLRSKGDIAGAFAVSARAAEAAPDMAAAHNNLGIAHFMHGRMAEAVKCYRRALEIDPEFPEVHNNLGNALAELEQDDEAIEALQKAVKLNPGFAPAQSNLGKLLIRKERLTEARAHLMKALSLDPDFAGAYHNLGVLYAVEGAFAESEACCQKAIALDGGLYMAYAGIARSRKMTADDTPMIERLERMVEEKKSMPVDERSHLYFALGKAYDDLGSHAQAFARYRKGNDLERDRRERFNRAGLETQMTRLIERFTPEFFQRYRHAGNDSDQPILIVGMMRSGTSLVEQILASHPQAYGAGELIYWAHEDRRLRPELKEPDVADVADVATRYLEHLRGFSPDARRITDKMPHNFLHLGLVRLAFPNARIIHTRRNPVDTCLSIYFQNFPAPHPYAYDLHDMVEFYRLYRRIMRHWQSVIPADRMIEVDYEDMVADQEGQTRRLLEFCGLPWDDACLSFQDNKRIVRTASSWQVRQPMYRSSVARWKRYETFIGPLAALLEEE